MLYKSILAGVLAVGVTISVFGQHPSISPIGSTPALAARWEEEAQARFKKDISTLSGPNKKYLADIYKERFEGIRSVLTSRQVITDPEANAYLNEIVSIIVTANPILKASELRVVLSNDLSANASSQGEGTILFHAGLFNRLANESEIAFVICHELAHYYLNHSNLSITHYVDVIYSDSFQQKLKLIRKTEYGQNKELLKLDQLLTFRTRKHSREHEQAADSMAIELLENTNYDLMGAIGVLDFLDSAGPYKFDGSAMLQKNLNFEAFAFKRRWIEEDDVLMFTSETTEKDKQLEDSLKTHPDCQLRIQHLKPVIAALNKPGAKRFIVSQDRFETLQKRLDFNAPEYCFSADAVAFSLYLSLSMLNIYPDNPRLQTLVGKCFNELYQRQREHKLNQVTDLPGKNHNSNYNELLLLIQNVRLQDFASLSFYYLSQHKETAGNDPEYKAVFTKSTENFNRQ